MSLTLAHVPERKLLNGGFIQTLKSVFSVILLIQKSCPKIRNKIFIFSILREVTQSDKQ